MRALAAVVLVLASGAAASARADTFEDAVVALDSDVLDVRDQATRSLVRLIDSGEASGNSLMRRAVQSAVAQRATDPSLSLEQRQRILSLLRDQFERTPRGAIGIEFSPAPNNRGVLVGRTVPGFPADRDGLLLAGDVILEIAGVVLPGAHDLIDGGFAAGMGGAAQWAMRSVIISHDPGDVVRLRVLRGATELDVEVPLGSLSALRQQRAMDDGWVREAAWKHRLLRLGGNDVDVLRLEWTVGDAAWRSGLSRTLVRPAPTALLAQNGGPGAGSIEDVMFMLEGIRLSRQDQVAMGEAEALQRDVMNVAGRAQVVVLPQVNEVVRQGRVQVAQPMLNERQRAIQNAMEQINQLRLEAREASLRAGNPDLGAEERERLERMAASLLRKAEAVEAGLADLITPRRRVAPDGP